MSQTIQSNARTLVESIARVLPPSAREDFRNLMNSIVLENLTALSPGGNLLQPGGPQAGGSAPPIGVAHAVTAKNGVLTVAIANPSKSAPTPIYHEFSYSPLASFTKNVTTLPPTTDTSINVPALPGNALYTRLRSSFDKKTWSNYQLSSTSPIDPGYIGSDATAPGATFNQSNYAIVNSQATSPPMITVNGAGERSRPTRQFAEGWNTLALRPRL